MFGFKWLAAALLIGLLVTMSGCPASAGLKVDPVIGASFISKDSDTESVGEVLVDVSYSFPWTSALSPRWQGSLAAQYGFGENGNQVTAVAYRTMMNRSGHSNPGLGFYVLMVDEDISEDISEDSVAIGPEVFLELPWPSGYAILPQKACVTGYAGVLFPVSGDDDFSVLRLGVRTGM